MMRLVTLVFDRECFVVKEKVQGLANIDKSINPTISSIFARYSCRKYTDKEVANEILATIIECGRVAPCGGNNQTTSFYVITERNVLDRLIQLVEKEFAAMELKEDLYKSLKNTIRLSKKGGYDFTYKAPVLIVMTNKKGYDNAMADSVSANMSMMLAATSLGLGTCYLNQLHWLDASKTLRSFLDIGEDETICCTLGLGYPAQERLKERIITGNPVFMIK